MPVSDEMVEVAKRAYSENQFGNGLDVRLRAALEAAEAVRGRTHVLVPKEPTIEMIEAGYLAARRERVTGAGGQTMEACLRRDAAREIAAYRAMLASSGGNRE